MQILEIISREEARARGLKKYFHGRPCNRGHVAERRVSSQTCIDCINFCYRKDPKNREKKRMAYWKEGGKEDRKKRNLMANYGITLDQYNDMCKAQNFLCAICGEPELRGLVVDHCHQRGHVRALLCIGCNLGLGGFGDDPAALVKAAIYLRRHSRG